MDQLVRRLAERIEANHCGQEVVGLDVRENDVLG